MRAAIGRPPLAARDGGATTLYMLVCGFPVFLLMAGLLFDGNAALAARERAADLANQAARAGADQITEASLRQGDPSALRIDPNAAEVAADRLVRAAGATGTLSVTGPDTVTATVRVSHPTAILSVIGIRQVSGAADASATVLHGFTTGVP